MTTRHRPQTVVITGASAGVGRATAEAFAQRGAKLALLARDGEALASFARELEAHWGVEVMTHPVDVADARAVDRAADAIMQRFGAFDVWINNAMVTAFAPLSALSADDYRRVTEVTYLGFVHGTMAALRHLRRRGNGVVVQVGSALAYRAIPLQSAYCGAKHAIRGFTDAVRSELLHERSQVRLTMVQMPALNTPQFDWAASTLEGAPRPVPPVYTPEAAARAIVWAVDHPRREVYVGRMTVLAVVANKFFPGLLDRYLARNAFKAQQRADHVGPHSGNLRETMPGHRTRGSFTMETSRRAPIRMSDRSLAVVAGGLALGLCALWRRR
ncbi:SDR family oxidoreductase [Luteibacter sp. CQ10]|uniref:SDR family oxidoreductase n=1 Tax=Luteibacter sp. CQ10 TaxID=2805821 RepID=UPI0034A12DFA